MNWMLPLLCLAAHWTKQYSTNWNSFLLLLSPINAVTAAIASGRHWKCFCPRSPVVFIYSKSALWAVYKIFPCCDHHHQAMACLTVQCDGIVAPLTRISHACKLHYLHSCKTLVYRQILINKFITIARMASRNLKKLKIKKKLWGEWNQCERAAVQRQRTTTATITR